MISYREQYLRRYNQRKQREEYNKEKAIQYAIKKDHDDKEREAKLTKDKADALISRDEKIKQIKITLDELYRNKDRKGVEEFVKDPYHIFCNYILPKNDTSYTKWFLLSSISYLKDVIQGGVTYCNYKVFHKINELNVDISIYKWMAGTNQTICDIIDKKIPYEKMSFTI
jgi:hypothetical protein